MYAVYQPNSELMKDYREILNVQHRFYSDLYRSHYVMKTFGWTTYLLRNAHNCIEAYCEKGL